MRLYFAMGLAVTWGGFMAATPASVSAAEVCHFLECVDGDTQAPAAGGAPNPSRPRPAIQNSRSVPKLKGEVCDSAGNLRYCVSSVLPPQYGFSYQAEEPVRWQVRHRLGARHGQGRGRSGRGGRD
jgi:hypothetical protein